MGTQLKGRGLSYSPPVIHPAATQPQSASSPKLTPFLGRHPVPQRRKQRAKDGYKGSYSWALCMPPCMYRLPMCLLRKESPKTMLERTLRVKGTWHCLPDHLKRLRRWLSWLGAQSTSVRAWMQIPGTPKQKCETLSQNTEKTLEVDLWLPHTLTHMCACTDTDKHTRTHKHLNSSPNQARHSSSCFRAGL